MDGWRRSGSEMVKVDPVPRALSRRMSPPCSSTKRLVSARPSPRASAFLCDRPTCLNLEHRVVLGRDADAGVLHRDLDARRVLLRRHGHAAAIGRNLTALERRFSTICLNLRSSARNAPRSLSTSSVRSIPWRWARSRTSTIAFESAEGRSKVEISRSMRPASIFERSRMSLISESRCLPDSWMSLR